MTDEAEAAEVAAITEHAADSRAVLRDLIADAGAKVTYVDVPLEGQSHRLLLDFNGWCDVEAQSDARWPIQTYRDLASGRCSVRAVRAIILSALKGGGGPEAKPGPIVDRLLADYPFSVAVGIAETALGAWLVGAPPPVNEA